MLTFEALLVKELQKQQSRAEFCDTVLQTQGVSVPVHSCVLSAFSPKLCGTLSAMPSPLNGQRRLIEIQAVEACTLLSLVSLLYSGQFKEDKEEVLLAACKLGINIPQREAKRLATEKNTQTEWMKELAERECQTESDPTFPSEYRNHKETIATVIGSSSCRSDQGLCTYTEGSDITLATLNNGQGTENPENIPSFQVMDVVPETPMYPSVSGPACLPQVFVCPPAASFQQPPTPLPTHPHLSHSTCVEQLANQDRVTLGSILEGDECVLEAFAQFENNIPGFINHFLDTNSMQAVGQREQSQRGTRGHIKTEGRARRERRAGLSEGFALKGEVLNICKREQNMNRFGRVPRSAWMGKGGGRVGRKLNLRQAFKNQVRRRRQGRGVMQEEGEKGKSSSRARQRKTGSRGRLVEPVCQDAAPPLRRRGRPRKHPLPQENDSRNFIGTSAPEQKTVTPPAPLLMHTAPLPAINHTGLTQPMDWLIDDVIAQLPFMPTNQHGLTNPVNVDSNVDHPRSQSPVKLTDLGVVQPQSEGELTDILDSFLRTFEQHVGVSESDVQDDITDGSQTCEHTNTSNAHATSMNTTTQGENTSLYKNRPQVSIVHKPQKPSGYWQVSDLTVEKSPAQQGEEKPENVRMTRSQSRKRKLEIIEELPRRNELPAKPKRERKKERLEKPMVEASLPREKKRRNREPHGEQKGTSSTVDSTCSVASALRRVINIASARNVTCSTKTTFQKTLDGSELHDRKVTSLVKRKQAGHAKRDSTKTLLEGRTLKVQSSTGTSQPKRQVLKNKSTGNKTRPALSAFELMKKILENQENREEERKGEYHRTVMKPKRNRRRKNTQVHGAEVLLTNNTEMDDTIMVEEHNNSRIHQRHEETKGRMEEVGNQMTMCLQQTLPPAKDCRMSNAEKLMENSYNKARLETADSPNEAPFQRCSTEGVMFKNMPDMPFVSHALDPTVPLEKLRNTQGETDGLEEDEDVDVVEVSSSLSESFSVLPITVDVVPSTEEEEDDEDEDLEIDVTSLGSN